ncbi:MAG: hypothetical protein Q8Q09_09410 [Deltaproteobacteria bacterium]|nr:hypothetical protein [Deltaproteobacteria bacterium]
MEHTQSRVDEPALCVQIITLPNAHLQITGQSMVTMADVTTALAQADRALASAPTIDTVVVNTEAVSRFARGAIVALARWLVRSEGRIATAVLIGPSVQLHSSVRALARCAPSLMIRSHAITPVEADEPAAAAVYELTG